MGEVARGAPREPRLWEKGPLHPGILGFVGRGREPTPTGPPEGGLYFDLCKSFRFTDAERFHHNLLIRFLHPRSHGSAGTAVITQGTVLGSGDTWRPPPYGVVQVSVTRGRQSATWGPMAHAPCAEETVPLPLTPARNEEPETPHEKISGRLQVKRA